MFDKMIFCSEKVPFYFVDLISYVLHAVDNALF